MSTNVAAEGDTLKRVGEIKRVTWIGLGVNVVLSALKLAAGIIGGSQAIVAEEVQQRLVSEGPRLTDVVVHVEPYEDEGSR